MLSLSSFKALAIAAWFKTEYILPFFNSYTLTLVLAWTLPGITKLLGGKGADGVTYIRTIELAVLYPIDW